MTRPTVTLKQRLERAKSDLNAILDGADAGIDRSPELALANALAGLTHDLQGLANWIDDQAVPGPDSAAETLERWLFLFGSPRKQPDVAKGTIRVPGVDTTPVPKDTEFQKADGTTYTTDAAATIIDQGGGNIYVDVAVTAVDPGQDGNAAVGSTVRLVSPVSGVDTEATVQDDGSGGGLTGGVDIESRDDMWSRLKVVIQNPPGTGNDGDYERWALEVAGVTRAWVEPQALGAGTVRVLFVRDNDSPIIPEAGEVTAVQDYIDARRPAGMAGFVAAAPTAKNLSFEISGISNATTRANVETSLKDLIVRNAEPGVTIEHEQIITAIGSVSNTKGFTLVSPAADVTHTALEIPVYDGVTWS